MKKRIIIILLIIFIFTIPFFIFNEGEATKKINKKNNKYITKDYINNLLTDDVQEVTKEKLVMVEPEYISKQNKFKYITTKYDHINEYLKEGLVEKIKYVYINNDDFITEDGKKYYYENGEKVKGIKLIDGVRYYFDFDTGELLKSDIKSVIDVSSWQGNIDFEKVKDQVDGVIVRIGYGTTDDDEPVLDSKFKRNIEELKRLDIPFGVYIFGYAQNINASNKEVEFILDTFNKYDISKDTYIWYDAELTTFNSFYYSKPIYNLVVDNFIFKLNELGFMNVGVYSNLYMLTKGSLSYDKKYPVWVAQYYNKCGYDKEYVGWQYTSDGHIDGIEGRVDMNIFY